VQLRAAACATWDGGGTAHTAADALLALDLRD
jgi:hypothetical protein